MPGILLSFLPRTPGHFRLPDYESSRSHTSAWRQHALADAFVARFVKYDLVRRFCSGQDALTFAHDSLFPSVPERDSQDL